MEEKPADNTDSNASEPTFVVENSTASNSGEPTFVVEASGPSLHVSLSLSAGGKTRVKVTSCPFLFD